MKRFVANSIFWLGGTALLAAFIWPLVYSVWISFTPSDFLEPPVSTWSLKWYRQFWDNPTWTDALWTSLRVGLWSAGLSLLLGSSLGFAAVRFPSRFQKHLNKAALLPLFVPAIVIGMGLLPVMHLTHLWGSDLSVVLAHTLVSMPISFIIILGALREFDLDLELAARGLGAGPVQSFFKVTVPLMVPSLVVSGLIAFVLSLNEFIIALFIGTPEVATLPKVIWPNLRYTLTPLVAAASSLTLVITLVSILVIVRLLRVDKLAQKLLL